MTKDNVTAAKPGTSGAAYIGATSATLPTSVSATLTGFTELGYITEDGLTNNSSPSSDVIKAWGGDIVLTLTESKEDTFTFTLMEAMSADVLKLVHGDDNVSGSLAAGITVEVNAYDPEDHAFVFDMVLKNDALKRIVVPFGKVTEVGEVTYSGGNAVGYEITIKCSPDSTGNTHYEYIKEASQ